MPVIIKKHVIEKKIILNNTIDSVFSFFNRIENLNQITPAWLQLQLLSPIPARLTKGSLLKFTFKLNGIPLKFKTEVSEWKAADYFVITQNEGPFLLWNHRHQFESKENKTIFYDRVEYAIPGGLLEPYLNYFYVAKKIKRVFNFRSQKLEQLFNHK